MGSIVISDDTERVVTSICRSHCGAACVLKVHVRKGVITKIESDDGQEPQYRACAKGRSHRQRVYHPNRLKYPMKRAGERGNGEFKRVSWDEALDIVASEIKRVRQTFGSSAIAFIYGGGDICWLHNPALIERLLVRYGGYSGTWGVASSEGKRFSAMATYGTIEGGMSPESLLYSHLIILWSMNFAETRGYGNYTQYLSQAKEAGIKIIIVDPRYTDSCAAWADQWIPIRPTTDTAMLVAMAYVIITKNLQDQAFLDKHTVGFNQFKDYVLGREDNVPKTPGWAEGVTGVPAATIVNLAKEYATTRPAALIDSLAPGRTAYGEQFHRAASTLAAMTGNIGILGGNAPGVDYTNSPLLRLGPFVAFRMKGGVNPVDHEAPPRKDSFFYQQMLSQDGGLRALPLEFHAGGPSSARVHRMLFADAILRGERGGYPTDYKLLYVVNLNPVNQWANTNRITQAMKALEFIVVQEQFMTPTAKFADILLPTNTFLERNDVTTGGVGPFFGYMNKTIESVGESKSHFEIATELAKKLGICDYSDKTEEEWLKEIIQGCKQIPDNDTFMKQGVHKIRFSRPCIPFGNQIRDPENNPFPTPSGKIEIFSQRLADMNNPLLPPIPKYIEAWENYNDSMAKQYPLQLITTHTKRRAHSQFDYVSWLKELYPQAISINPADAEVRGIKDGDMVRAFNNRGEMIIPAKVTERIMPGVVDIPQGAWYEPDKNGVDRGGCANILTKDAISPGGAFCSNTALVQVEKALRRQ